MNELKSLLKIKSLVTIALTIVFCYLSCIGTITAEQFMTIFAMIVSFFFAKQFIKE